MAALRTVSRLKGITTFLNKQRCISSSTALQAGWNKDWMPENYPQNEEERKESALNHGLVPGDYTPIPNDGDGHGDYPDFDYVGEEQKDPFHNFDDPVLKRDFGEPLHLYYEALMRDKGDPAHPHRTAPRVMLATMVGLIVSLLALHFLSMPFSMINSKYDHWYPYDDLKAKRRRDPCPSGQKQTYYTFEPVE